MLGHVEPGILIDIKNIGAVSDRFGEYRAAPKFYLCSIPVGGARYCHALHSPSEFEAAANGGLIFSGNPRLDGQFDLL